MKLKNYQNINLYASEHWILGTVPKLKLIELNKNKVNRYKI